MDFTGCPPAVLYITGQVSPVGNLLVSPPGNFITATRSAKRQQPCDSLLLH
jgi:hypothetical protein